LWNLFETINDVFQCVEEGEAGDMENG